MASPDSAPWPPPNGLCTPTVSRKEAVFQTPASIRISAPASRVFEILLDTSKYPEWNSFVPKVEIMEQPGANSDVEETGVMKKGTIMTFQVVMNEKKPENFTPTGLQVTDISTPSLPSEYLSPETLQDASYSSELSEVYRISWKSHGGFASRGLKTERFHEVLALGEKACEVRTWEVYGGLLAYAVKGLYKKTLEDKFVVWVRDLKRFAEGEGVNKEMRP